MELPLNQIICGDCLEVMKTFPDKSIDLVVTDPPYNVGKQFENWNEGKVFDENFHKKWISEVCRILKPNGGGLYMCWAGASHLRDMMITFGEIRQVLFWTKPFAMMVKNRKGWHCFTETIFWKVLSDDFYFNLDNNEKRRDYFTYTSSIHRPQEHDHPTQKPLPLISQLILASSKKDDIIFDPFLGSGTTAVAAKQLKRNFIGIEISEKYCQIAKQRLRQELLF